ncbi:MAG TPA: hypothetical protein VFR14_06985 [Candidatus Limnocylindrales bacterium]|nr:hypothetical protein [Candidatus Limnocylindrales bacterium]
MTDRSTLDRVVTDWLHADATSAGSDRVLAAALVRVSSTGQERPSRLARFADMKSTAKLALAAAAVVIVAVVALNLLPGRGGGVGGGPTAPPSVAPSPTVQPSPSPSPAAAFPSDGPLSIGIHSAVLDGVPLRFSVSAAGWTSAGTSLGMGEYGQPDYAGIDFWSSAPDNVYADPCAHTPLDPPPSQTAAGLAAAAAAVPGTELVSGPASTEVGGRPAQHIILTIREDLGCDPHEAYLWYDESTGGASGGWRWAEGLGATYWVWIVDVDGTLVWINAYTFKGAGPELAREIMQIVDSIEFE